MKLTINQILHVNMAIENIMKDNIKMKFQTAYDLLKIKDELDRIEEYVASRMKMVGLIGGEYSNDKEKIENEILSSVVEIECRPIMERDLINDEGFLISLSDLEKLRPVLS